MASEYNKKQVKTHPVILEPGNDGLRVLARMIVRVHMKRLAKRLASEDGFSKDKV